jgi:TolB-like protein/tetratricopeptide (TPR) repeat protein
MSPIYRFGPFRLDPDAGIVFCGNEPAALGQRAVALLRVLLERAGNPVSKEDLINAAWPGLTVEDNNLTVQIAALRRVLESVPQGATWIETMPRRGYRYVGPTVALEGPPNDVPPAPSLPLPEQPSIAVLSFANLSGDPTQDYFADGIVDEIITGLSRVKWMFVIARSSTFTYKGRAVDVKRVGAELGVRYVLEGTVRKAVDRVRVTVQLVIAASGAHVWAERYDRSLGDIFTLQDEIAMSVVGAIEPSVRQAEVERVTRQRPESLSAYDLAMRALPDVYGVMPATVTKALVLLDRALAIEPTYATAHGYAAMCHHCLFLRNGLQEQNRAASIRHAQAALSHGRDDAVALTFAGFSLGMDAHDRGAAFAAFEAALELSPSLAQAYILGAAVSSWAGEAPRTIDWAQRALRLSPFDPWKFIAYRSLALAHFLLAQHELAADAARRAVQFNPGFGSSYMLLAAPLVKLGRHAEAEAAIARLKEREPAFRLSGQLRGVNCAPPLAAALVAAFDQTGIPQ